MYIYKTNNYIGLPFETLVIKHGGPRNLWTKWSVHWENHRTKWGIFPPKDDPIHGRWVLAICHGFPKVLQGGSFGKVRFFCCPKQTALLSVVWHKLHQIRVVHVLLFLTGTASSPWIAPQMLRSNRCKSKESKLRSVPDPRAPGLVAVR